MSMESEPLPEVAVGRGEGDAGSAWFQSDHPLKRVGQSEGPRFMRVRI